MVRARSVSARRKDTSPYGSLPSLLPLPMDTAHHAESQARLGSGALGPEPVSSPQCWLTRHNSAKLGFQRHGH